ncbi:MAG: hypothetical protein ACK5GN_14195 [Pseudomonadota bacterium]
MAFDKTVVAVPPASEAVSVAVWDARPYVLSGEKSPEWVGLQRSGWGIPFGVHTSSGAPLRKEFSQSIVSSFSKAGFSARDIDVPDKISDAVTVEKLASDRGKVIILEIFEWKTDTMVDVNFSYDLAVKVLNSGVKVAEERIKGDEKLDGSSWNPVSASERVATAKQKERLDDLFATQAIRDAISNSNGKPPVEAKKQKVSVSKADPTKAESVKIASAPSAASSTQTGSCSVEQVLTMKGSGLSDSQIRAACTSRPN